jgi:hypothetical protein
VDSAHLYWTDNKAEAIARANLDGSDVRPSYIPLGGQIPWGLAVDATHLYWSNQMPRSIGRADLNGQNVEQSFIGAAGEGIYGLAVQPGPTTQTARTACPPPDRVAPQVSGLTLSRHVFAAASRGAGIARRRSRIPVGAQLRYRLSEDAAVRFTIKRRAAGRMVRGKCSRRTRRNRARRKCTLGLRGAITVHGARGLNRVKFRGRLRGRELRPGRYVLVAVAKDRAGNRSRAATVQFRIRRR